jgi:hypothetical protein
MADAHDPRPAPTDDGPVDDGPEALFVYVLAKLAPGTALGMSTVRARLRDLAADQRRTWWFSEECFARVLFVWLLVEGYPEVIDELRTLTAKTWCSRHRIDVDWLRAWADAYRASRPSEYVEWAEPAEAHGRAIGILLHRGTSDLATKRTAWLEESAALDVVVPLTPPDPQVETKTEYVRRAERHYEARSRAARVRFGLTPLRDLGPQFARDVSRVLHQRVGNLSKYRMAKGSRDMLPRGRFNKVDASVERMTRLLGFPPLFAWPPGRPDDCSPPQ